MGFVNQTLTLTYKNLLITLFRHAFTTTLRALVLPVVFMFFISYAKNFFVPPAVFGIGSPTPVRSLDNALINAGSGRHIVALVNNGFTDGQIGNVISNISGIVQSSGRQLEILENDSQLTRVCPSSLRAVSPCIGAASFYSSPDQGPGGRWNYTLRFDGSLGEKVYVDQTNNDVEIYVLPLQHAIDSAIAAQNASGPQLSTSTMQYPFTSKTQEERATDITQGFQPTVISVLAIAFFIGICGIIYQMVGHMALERELGMSQLIETMMPNRRRWEPQAARLISYHLAFDLIYLPGWIAMGIIPAYLVFPDSNPGAVLVLHLLTGFSLASFSLLFGSFFRKAQLSGITGIIISLVLAVIAQIAIAGDGSTGSVIILGLLFPPCTYVFSIIGIAGFQEDGLAWNLTRTSPNINWKVSGIIFWIFFILQIFIFPLMAAYIEKGLYGTGKKGRHIHHDSSQSSVAVKLTDFTKRYDVTSFVRKIFCCGLRRKDPVVAVNKFNLEVLHGQICVLLGANGSGKSTSLDAIAGLNDITEGTIDVDGTGGLGLCPQKNVLWDEVTVFEHVMIFNKLKTLGAVATKDQSAALVNSCDLSVKLHAEAGTLSGGQKRKLQLAMMFTGGSRVCCVDEVSSGIDPLARRKIWDILLAERGRRSILLTTHFLDEADVLSDHIAILSKGILKAEGTAVELKNRLGSGYRVFIPRDVPNRQALLEKVSHFDDYDQTVAKFSDSTEVSGFISRLEESAIQEYRVQGPTVEDVFLKLADEINIDLSSSAAVQGYTEDAAGQPSPTFKEKAAALDLGKGQGTGLWLQSWILFLKRFTVIRRNYFPYMAAWVIPIIAAGLVPLFIIGLEPLGCDPSSQDSAPSITDFSVIVRPDIPYGPPNDALAAILSSVIPTLNSSNLHPQNTFQDFQSYVSTNFHNVTPGGFFLDQSPTFNYRIEDGVYPALITQSLLDSISMGAEVNTGYQPFATPFVPSTGDSLQLILYFGLAMSVYPAFFALYPTAERIRKVRALHYSNGIRSGPIWIAYTAFDFISVLFISAIAIILFIAQWDGWYAPGYLFVVFFLYGLTSSVFSYVISMFVTSQLAAFAFSAGAQCLLFLIYFIAYLAIQTFAPIDQIDNDLTVAHFVIALFTPSGNMARALLLTLNEFSILCRGESVESYPGDIRAYGGPILYLIVQFFVLLAFLVWWDAGGRPTWITDLFRRKSSHKDAEAETAGFGEVKEELSRIKTANDGLRALHLSKKFGDFTAVEDVTFGIERGEVFALLGPNGAGKSTTISLIRNDLVPSDLSSEVFIAGQSLQKNRVAARNNMGVCPQFDAIDSMTVLEHLRFYARARGVPDAEHNVQEVIRAVGLNTYGNRLAINLSGGNKRKLSLGIALMGNPTVLLLDEPSSGMDAAAKRVMWSVLGSVTTGRALLITTHSMEEADALAHRAGIMAKRMLALGTSDDLRKQHGDVLNVHVVHKSAPHTSAEEMEHMRSWVLRNIPGAIVEDRTYHGQLRFSVPAHKGGMTADRLPEKLPDHGAVFEVTKAGGVDTTTDATESIVSSSAPSTPVKGDGFGQGIGALFNVLERHRDELGYAYYSVSPTTLDQVFLNVVNKHNVEEENYAAEHAGDASKAKTWSKKVGKAMKAFFR